MDLPVRSTLPLLATLPVSVNRYESYLECHLNLLYLVRGSTHIVHIVQGIYYHQFRGQILNAKTGTRILLGSL